MENDKNEQVEKNVPVMAVVEETHVVPVAAPVAAPVVSPDDAKTDTMDDIFITEQNTFDCVVEFYRDNEKLLVKNLDEGFDVNHTGIRKIAFTCKHPSQGDYEMMLNSPTYKNMQNAFRPIDMIALELTRLSLLIRSWSLNQDFSRMVELDPQIIRGMTVAISNHIGTKIIF